MTTPYFSITLYEKETAVPAHAKKVHSGSGGIAPLIVNLSTR
jgi:hypothetical protein